MKKDEIRVGNLYQAKVSDRIVRVRIDSTNSHGGWNATNTATDKRIHIKSAQRLRREVKPGKDLAAAIAADHENARAREERAAAPDGMTAAERAMTKSAGKKTRGAQAEAPEVNPTVEIITGQADPTKKPRAKKVPAEPKPKRVSALDAAAEVLKADNKPMKAKELIEAMAARGLWTSPGGKTPEATLYAAIIREIATKGDQARFRKVERGQFEFNAPVAVEA